MSYVHKLIISQISVISFLGQKNAPGPSGCQLPVANIMLISLSCNGLLDFSHLLVLGPFFSVLVQMRVLS